MKRFHRILPPLALLAAAWALYLPSLGFDFTLDDPLVTTENAEVAPGEGGIPAIFAGTLYSGTRAAEKNASVYRPLLKLSMVLNHRLAGSRFLPSAFHLGNVLLYGACVLIVYLLLTAMLGCTARGRLLSFCAALLFLFFPGHLESVCNVKHREEILACLFGLAGWLVHLRAPRSGGARCAAHALGSGALVLAGILSKESALLLVPCIFLWDWIRRGRRGASHASLISAGLAQVGAAGIYLLLRWNALGALVYSEGTHTFYKPAEGVTTRLLVSARIFCERYLYDQIIGLDLSPAFSSRFILLADPPGGPVGVAFAALLLAAAVLSAWMVVRRRSIFFFWAVFFFITSFRAVNLIPVGTGGAYRLMFTPSLGICAMIVLGLDGCGRRLQRKRVLGARTRVVLLCCFLAVLCLYWVHSTLSLMGVWRSNATVFARASRLERSDPMSRYAAGRSFGALGRADLQEMYYREALDRFQRYRSRDDLFTERSLDAFSVVTTEIGFLEVADDPRRALDLAVEGVHLFERLQELRGRPDSNIAGPYYVQALALERLGRYGESRRVCEEALSITRHRGLEDLLENLPAPVE